MIPCHVPLIYWRIGFSRKNYGKLWNCYPKMHTILYVLLCVIQVNTIPYVFQTFCLKHLGDCGLHFLILHNCLLRNLYTAIRLFIIQNFNQRLSTTVSNPGSLYYLWSRLSRFKKSFELIIFWNLFYLVDLLSDLGSRFKTHILFFQNYLMACSYLKLPCFI